MVDAVKDKAAYAGINERSQHLLKVLIERYIASGQPVGSRTLSRGSGLDLSPATIRNVMADLEDLGFLYAPHTSAGRVPTARGYRFFVDSLLQIQPLDRTEVASLRRQFDPDQSTAELLTQASTLLSSVTHLASVVMIPRRDTRALRHVEFLPLSDNRVLAILVLNEREVQNRIIYAERSYTTLELQQAANFLNAQFSGKDIKRVRSDLLRDMRETRATLDRIMQAAIEMADKAFENDTADEEDYVLAGQTNLMGSSGLSDVDKLRQLFEAFNRKRDILLLFDHCLKAQGVQIFIGEEAGFNVLDDLSVVTAPYSEGEVIGVLGVIGPTRMAYERVIPIVDVTAKLLAAALNSRT